MRTASHFFAPSICSLALPFFGTMAAAAEPSAAPVLIAQAAGSSVQAPTASAQAPEPSKQTVPAPTPAVTNPAAPTGWFSGIKLSFQAEGGIVFNPQRPSQANNFGQLFTDKANQFQLNQILLTAQKAIDPKETGFAVGGRDNGAFTAAADAVLGF